MSFEKNGGFYVLGIAAFNFGSIYLSHINAFEALKRQPLERKFS